MIQIQAGTERRSERRRQCSLRFRVTSTNQTFGAKQVVHIRTHAKTGQAMKLIEMDPGVYLMSLLRDETGVTASLRVWVEVPCYVV